MAPRQTPIARHGHPRQAQCTGVCTENLIRIDYPKESPNGGHHYCAARFRIGRPDIERRAAMYGIPVQLPAPYPAKQSVVANLVATVGMGEGWGADYVRAAYRRRFQLGQETGSEPNVSESLRDMGQDPKRVIALANSEGTKAALTAETDTARELGIFGSPTFVVDRELF